MDDMESGNWIPLVEFSVQKGISLSTLRRYIKSNKIPWKLVDGRYLVMDDGTVHAPRPHSHPHLMNHEAPPSPERVRELEMALMAAHEEITELKTLVAYYEEKFGGTE